MIQLPKTTKRPPDIRALSKKALAGLAKTTMNDNTKLAKLVYAQAVALARIGTVAASLLSRSKVTPIWLIQGQLHSIITLTRDSQQLIKDVNMGGEASGGN